MRIGVTLTLLQTFTPQADRSAGSGRGGPYTTRNPLHKPCRVRPLAGIAGPHMDGQCFPCRPTRSLLLAPWHMVDVPSGREQGYTWGLDTHFKHDAAFHGARSCPGRSVKHNAAAFKIARQRRSGRGWGRAARRLAQTGCSRYKGSVTLEALRDECVSR